MFPATSVLLDLEAEGVDSSDIGAGAAAALFACLCAATFPGSQYRPPSDMDVIFSTPALLEAAINPDKYLRFGPYQLGFPDDPIRRLVHPPILREAKQLLAPKDRVARPLAVL